MSLPPDFPLAHETPRPDRPIVVAANRLPVMRTDDGWTASPGGLVRALLPMLRDIHRYRCPEIRHTFWA